MFTPFLFRIVIVSSLAHEGRAMNWDDINFRKSYDTGHAYCQSKLANVLHGKELARRLENSGITVYILHPGNNFCCATKFTIELSDPDF